MRHPRLVASSFALALAGAALLAAGAAASTPASSAAVAVAALAQPSGAFQVDTTHSAVIYRIKHLGVAFNYGRFNEISGSFLLDAAKPEASILDVSVKADSIDSANADRDKHLRSPDFFSTKEFPTLTFKSTAVKAGSNGAFEVSGNLTLRGQSRPLTITVKDTGRGPARGGGGGEVAGLETTFTIKRSDFGMNYMVGKGLDDEVTLTVALEGGRK